MKFLHQIEILKTGHLNYLTKTGEFYGIIWKFLEKLIALTGRKGRRGWHSVQPPAEIVRG
jgi:hypothetical protein